MRHLENMAAGEPCAAEFGEPELGDGIECGAFARHPGESVLPVPNTVKRRNTVADDHQSKLRVGRHRILTLPNKPRAILRRQPVNGTDLARVHRLASADRQRVVNGEDL